MASIFLSYAREDRATAQRLANVLEQAHHHVWWDSQIRTGGEFSAEIEAALDKADVVLVAWSANSAKSPWVRDEAAIGRDSGRLLPVLIDGGKPPLGFRQFQALDLAGWKAQAKDPRTRALIEAVESHFSGGAPAPSAAKPRRLASLRHHALFGVAIAGIAIIGAAIAAFLWTDGFAQREAVSKPTIGVLPFANASSDAELSELGAQIRASLAHSFAQSGAPLRIMDSAPAKNDARVDFLISGDLSKAADKIVATVRLNEVAHGVTVFSHRFEVAGDDVQNLPERVGAQMAGNLTWSVPMLALDRRRPLEPALLTELLQGYDFADDPFGPTNYLRVKRVAAKAPEVLPAQVGLAFQSAFVLAEIPRNEREEVLTAARRALARAIELGPNFGDTHGAWCLLHSETRLTECEDRLRIAMRVDPDAPFLTSFLSQLLRSVGRFDEAMDLTRLSYAHDLYVPTKIGWMLQMLEYSGDEQAARALYDQGLRWWPEYKQSFVGYRLSARIYRGDFDGLSRLEQELGEDGLPPDYQASASLVAALRSGSLGSARQICAGASEYWLQVRCMLVLSRLADQDGAYALAAQLYPRRVGRTPAETERIWLDDPYTLSPLDFVTSPGAAAFRRDPRYLELAQRVGLLAYWRNGQSPDFCRKEPEPICANLLKPTRAHFLPPVPPQV